MWHGSTAVVSVRRVEGPSPDEDAYLLAVGRAIRSFRKAHRRNGRAWTGEHLGSLVGVDKNSISRWENGRTSLSAYNLHQLAEALGVDGDWLIRPADSLNESEARAAIVRRAAVEAARAEAEGGPDLRVVGGGAAPRDTKPRRTQPRSPK